MPNPAAVMTLNHATMFPQALLPLDIFGLRCRQMLADALRRERMFSIALLQTENLRTAHERADLVACAPLPDPSRRQAILESVDPVDPLRKLLRFLLVEVRHQSENPPL